MLSIQSLSLTQLLIFTTLAYEPMSLVGESRTSSLEPIGLERMLLSRSIPWTTPISSPGLRKPASTQTLYSTALRKVRAKVATTDVLAPVMPPETLPIKSLVEVRAASTILSTAWAVRSKEDRQTRVRRRRSKAKALQEEEQ